MWNSPRQEKRLTSAEINFLIRCAGDVGRRLVDETEVGTDSVWVPALDRMGAGERALAVRQVVANATNPAAPAAASTAWEEGVIDFLVREFFDGLSRAFECRDEYREGDAFLQKCINEDKALLLALGVELAGDDEDALDDATETVLDIFLWDRDYQMESVVQDAQPAMSEKAKKQLGISDDYYLNPGPSGTKMDEADALAWLNCLFEYATESDEWKREHSGHDEKTIKAFLAEKHQAQLATLHTGAPAWLDASARARLQEAGLLGDCFPLVCKPNGREIQWKEVGERLVLLESDAFSD